MNNTLSDIARISVVMVLVAAVIAIIVTSYFYGRQAMDMTTRHVADNAIIRHEGDLEAMSIYGEPVPVPQVMVALQLYGTPESICLQMEDLRGTGTPYPIAYRSKEEVDALVAKLANYTDKEVYVYTASPNDGLQICISELSHETNEAARLQNWR